MPEPNEKRSRWCVGWQHPKTGKTVYCATFRGKRPSAIACSDRTLCGHYVIMRSGTRYGRPTCPECLAKERANA